MSARVLGARAVLVGVLGLAFAPALGCRYELHPVSGEQACAPPTGKRCPGGYYCAGDERCWLNGSGPGGPTDPSMPDASSSQGPDGSIAVNHPDGATAADGPGGGDGGRKAGNGQTCATGGDCTSGNCVESVCCDKPCSDTCFSCLIRLTASSPDGTCAVISSGLDDPQGRCGAAAAPSSCGNTGHCDGKGACQKLGSTTMCGAAACENGSFTPAATCDGKGACGAVAAQDCRGFACAPATGCATTCTTDATCTGGYCTSAGTCATKKIDGTACVGNNECLHGQCVAGVCCETACTGTCMSCAMAETGETSGLCRPILARGSSKGKCAADTTTCGHDGTCDGNGGCRFVTAGTSCGNPTCTGNQLSAVPTCNGAGGCPVPGTSSPCPGGVVCAASGTACRSPTCTADADCASVNYCASGMCSPKKTNGGACTGNNQCSLGFCVAGLCCESACTDTCFACAQADTTLASGLCRPVKAGGSSGGKCAVDTTMPCLRDGTCNGTGGCRAAGAGLGCGNPSCSAGRLVAAPTCDGSGRCVTPTVSTACPGGVVCSSPTACGPATCARDTDCLPADYCAGGTCTTRKAQGASCVATNECMTGQTCVGGICCESACNTTCNSCAQVDTGQSNGLCRATRAGGPSRGLCPNDNTTCGRDGTCSGTAGVCRFGAAGTMCGPTACAAGQIRGVQTCNGSGMCLPPPTTSPCPGGVNCSTVNPAVCLPPTCTADGDCVSQLCVSGSCRPKTAQGQTCAADRECVTGHCVDTVCCDTTCTGSCESCNVSGSAGACRPVTGTPRTGHPACMGTDACVGTCRGTLSTCVMPGTETSCRDPSCNAGTGIATLAATCNGTGTCPAPVMRGCSPFTCGGTACRTMCSANTDCVSADYCAAPACVPKKLPGAVCASLNECTTGICGGRCCTSACTCPQPTMKNLLRNPGFDIDISGWTMQNVQWTNTDSDGCPFSGSVQVLDVGATITQCVNIAPNSIVTASVTVRNTLGFGAGCLASGFTGPNCTGTADNANFQFFGTTSLNFAVGATGFAQPATDSSLLINCQSTLGSWFDKVFVSISGGSF